MTGTAAKVAAAGAVLLGIGACATGHKHPAASKPTITVTQPAVTASAGHEHGRATEISSHGVYVVGKDITGGTWHTSGGGECYYATLNGPATDDIVDYNDFIGPDTVNLSGVYAFEIGGGCTWHHQGG